MYRVLLNKNGDFMAIRVGANPNVLDMSNSFATDDWTVFQQELRHRIVYETTQELRETATKPERRNRATKFPFTYK